MKNYSFAVTVTGAAGFVGSHLCRAFLESPYDVRVLATDLYGTDTIRLTDCATHDDFSYEEYNVHQPLHSDFLAVDSFYHLAGIADPKMYLEDPLRVMSLNLDGLRNVLERIERWSKHRPRIIYTSTSEVYGKSAAVPFDEEETDLVYGPTQVPRWSYAMTKAVGEHYLRAYARKDLQHTIFRLFNVVGTDIDELGSGRVLSQMIGDALKNGEIIVVEPGTQTRCFTWIDDVVDLLMRPTLLKKPYVIAGVSYEQRFHVHAPAVNVMFDRKGSQTVNCGGDEEISMTDLAMLIGIALGEADKPRPKITLQAQEEHYGPGYEDVMRRVPDVRRSNEIFAWKATTDINEIVRLSVEAALGKGRDGVTR